MTDVDIESMVASVDRLAGIYSPNHQALKSVPAVPKPTHTEKKVSCVAEVVAPKVAEANVVVVPQVVKEVSIDTKTEKNTALGSAKVEVLKAANMEQVFPVLAKQIVSLASPPPSTFIRGRAEASAVPANEEKGEVVAEDEEEKAEAGGGGEEKLEEESAGLEQAMELVAMHAVSAMAPTTPCLSQPGFTWSSSPPRQTGKLSLKQIVNLASPLPSTFIRGRTQASAVSANEEKGEVGAEDEEEKAEAGEGGEEEVDEAEEVVGMHAVSGCPGFSWSSSPPRHTEAFSSEVDEGNVNGSTLSESEEEEEVVAEDEVEKAEAGGGGEDKVNDDSAGIQSNEEVSFSVEELEYDEATGQFSHQGHPIQFASPELRDEVLAKMFPSPSLCPSLPSTTSTCTSVPAPKPVYPGQAPAFPKPLNLRHQQQRLAFAHLKTSSVKSLGKQTRWTKELLLTNLENAISNPRLGIHWADFSEEEKLGTFDMIDWAAAYPDDIPSRSLLLESEDQWSTWA